MPTDLTGTPTSLGIGTYNVDADAPSGLGFNEAMAQIDALIAARLATPSGIASGEVPVWNGTTWARSSVTPMAASGISGYPTDVTKTLHGDGSWQSDELVYAQITANVTFSGVGIASSTTIISSGTVAFDGKPVIVEFFCPGLSIPASDSAVIVLFDGGASVAQLAQKDNRNTSAAALPVLARMRFTPSAGNHNYIAEAYLTSSGTGTVIAGTGTGGTNAPAYIRFTRAST